MITLMPTLQWWLASIIQDLIDSIFLISSWEFLINFLLDLHLAGQSRTAIIISQNHSFADFAVRVEDEFIVSKLILNVWDKEMI